MSIGQVAFHKGTQGTSAACLTHGGAPGDTISAVAACTREGFSQQGVARAEVRVEAAMCQPGFFHDVGDAHAVETAPPDRPRGGRDNAFVAEFLAAGWVFHRADYSAKYDDHHTDCQHLTTASPCTAPGFEEAGWLESDRHGLTVFGQDTADDG